MTNIATYARVSCHGPDNNTDLNAYVNSETYPYFIMVGSKSFAYGMKLGDLAYVENLATNQFTFAILADVGHSDKGDCGEGSLKLLRGWALKKQKFRLVIATMEIFALFYSQIQKQHRMITNSQDSIVVQPIDIKNKGEIIFRRIISNNKKNSELFKTTVANKRGFK